MSSTDPPSDRSGATRHAGAVRAAAAGRRGLFILLALLVLLVILAGLLYALLHGGGSASPNAGPVIAGAPGSSSLANTQPSASTPPATSPPADTTGTSSSAISTPATAPGLEGGGTVPPQAIAAPFPTSKRALGIVLFAEAKATLTPYAQKVIRQAADRLEATRPRQVVVTGYTDAIAGQPVNKKLSQHRAENVVAALRADVHGPDVKYIVRNLGQHDPVASNSSPRGRRLNRRVTITVS